MVKESSVSNHHATKTQTCYPLLVNSNRLRGDLIVNREVSFQTITAHVEHEKYVAILCCQQGLNKHSYIHEPWSRQPRSTDVRQDARILKAIVADCTAVYIRANIATVVSIRIVKNCLLIVRLCACVSPMSFLIRPHKHYTRLQRLYNMVTWSIWSTLDKCYNVSEVLWLEKSIAIIHFTYF